MELQSASPRWNTAPIGAAPQPDYLDQLLLLRGTLEPLGWLRAARAAEAAAGRLRSLAAGPRTLDVDVILVEGESREGPELILPHPALLTRPYLLLGAAALVPDWRLPGSGRTLAELARARLAGPWRPPAPRGGADPPAPGSPAASPPPPGRWAPGRRAG